MMLNGITFFELAVLVQKINVELHDIKTNFDKAQKVN